MTSPLAALLDRFTPQDEEEAAVAAQLRQFLAHAPSPYSRDSLVAHVVADAWIVNPARTHVVLVEHGLNQAWMAPGGHCDGDPDVFAAARREAEEETGLTSAQLRPLLGGGIFDLHSGHVPLRRKPWGIEPAHVHFDVCFAFEAAADAPLRVSDESTGLAWVPLADIETRGFFEGHLRRIRKTRAGLPGAAAAEARRA